MGGGASKKKGGKPEVHVASTVAQGASDDTEKGSTPSTPMPEKPKAAADVKRPQRKKGSKGSGQASSQDGSGADDAPGPSPGPSPSPQPAAKAESRNESSNYLPEAPLLPGSRVPATQDGPAAQASAAAGASSYSQPAAAPAPAIVEPTPQKPLSPAAPQREVKPDELIAACREGDLATVEAFLMNLSQTGAEGFSESSEALFDAYGDSVLHHAVHGGSVKVVQSLVQIGRVQVDIPNARNETALQIACRRGHGDIVAILLQANADPDRRDGNGLTPFLSAVFASAGEATLTLLVQARANIGVQDDRGISSLHFAALRGDSLLIQWLLQHEANADLQTEHGTTPLMLAARRGNLDSVSLLLDGKANSLLTDEAGCTALMHALSAAHSDVATKILETTKSLELVDCAGRSALFHAVLGGRADGIVAVIKRGGRVNIIDEEGRSPLYQACLMGEQVLVQCLLEADADPNLAGRGTTVRPAAGTQGEDEEIEKESDAARACLDESRTCLQVCTALAHNDLIGSILEHGADINAAPGALGWTALHLCAAVGNDEGAGLLLNRGATTSLHDADGNTAEMLAERAGHKAVLEKLIAAAASEPAGDAGAAERRPSLRTSLPPLHAHPEPEPPAEEQEPLALFAIEWQQREANGSLLDRVYGPMVHDALQSDQWKIRWEALAYLLKRFADVPGSPADLVRSVSEIVLIGVKGNIPKVFHSALGIFEELLSDARSDVLSAEEFTALLQGKRTPMDEEGALLESTPDIILALLDQTDAGGGDSRAGSTQQAAVDTLCSCILHGRVPLDEAAWPLLARIDRRLADEFITQDKKEAALSSKCLAANLKFLGRWLSTFGLQQSGLFRRALVLPLLIRGVASESSKVRSAAIDGLIQLVSLSGGVEERIWNLLDAKKRKAVQRHATSQECTTLLSAVACEEDALPKTVIISEDSRADMFICVSELTPQAFASLQKDLGNECKSPANWKDKFNWKGGPEAQAKAKAKAKTKPAAEPASPNKEVAAADDVATAKLLSSFRSKNWKERAESITALTAALSASGEGVQVIESADGMADAANSGASAAGPLLSQYVLKGHRLCTLQESLGTLLGDTVTAVFVAAADLLRLACSHMPLYIAPLFLEPLLPALVGRLLDTSKRTNTKAAEIALEVASLHSCALSEMIAQCVASGSAWSSTPSTPGGASSSKASDTERSTGPRLQLLVRLMSQVQEQSSLGSWSDDSWKAVAAYSMKAAEHRNGDVRKDAAGVLNTMKETGGLAADAADRAIIALQQMAQQKMGRRPGTGSTRLNTGSTRLSTGLRPGSNAGLGLSGRISNLGSTGRLSTGRLSTASLRPKSGALGASQVPAEESDNSVHSDDGKEPRVPGSDGDGTPAGNGEAEDGIAFMDVKTACPGADETLELADGEAALAEALPLAEALDEVALDFVAPLIALFGDGWTRCFYSRHWQCRVAALMHLSASMPHRLEELNAPETATTSLGELLDGSMRAVHEGLGDQNVRVYAEACRAVTAVVPAFCGAVDGRLLVAHLAPLLRQLCSRMGDSKEVVRTQTTQSLFRLLRPPTGNIVSPVALAMLILRHLVPQKEKDEEKPNSPSKGKPAAATGWLCRLAALRDLAKEYHKTMVMQPGASHPGEWLRLKDGLAHPDPTTRHESARLYTLICKMHLRSLGDEEAQKAGRESWVAALPMDSPAKSVAQIRRLLKLPEKSPSTLHGGSGSSPKRDAPRKIVPPTAWDVPSNLAAWAGCPLEVLAALKSPLLGDEKAILTSLRILAKAAASPEEAAKREGAKPEEAFAGICRAIQQVLGNETGADRRIFLSAIDLCQQAISGLSPLVSGLDVNMCLGKTFPTLLDRTSLTADVKIAVASDKLVQQLAKHPKVGCEAVTKMVISAVGRADHPTRPLVLLRTLLSDFGLRLCAQKDVVQLLLGSVATQLERVEQSKDAGEDPEALRSQLTGVLATCNQFSPDTVMQGMAEQDASLRKMLVGALQAAPNPRLVALGASAAEQESMERAGHMAGSAVRAASRGRDSSPKPDSRQRSPRDRMRPPPGPLPTMGEATGAERLRRQDSNSNLRRSEGRLPRAQNPSGSPPIAGSRSSAAEGSPIRVRTHRRQRSENSNPSPAPRAAGGGGNDLGTSLLSEASTTASAEATSPPQHDEGKRQRFPGGGNATSSSSSSLRWSQDGQRPPAPMELSTVMGNGREKWKFKEGSKDGEGGDMNEQWRDLAHAPKEQKENSDSLAALMDVLSQMKQDNPSQGAR